MVVRCTGRHLLWGTLICSFLDIVNHSVQDHPSFQVNGILGGSVVLPVNLKSEKTVVKIKWHFRLKPGEILHSIADFTEGVLKRTNSSDRFGQRLEMVNETKDLRIKDLELEDSGIYEADVQLDTADDADSESEKPRLFNLTVYEPVPQLQILLHNVSRTPEGCNMTLQCDVAGMGEFNVSWERGEPPRALEEGSDGYHLSNNVTNLHLFWRFNASDANVTCLVSNPADQKNVSFNLLKGCPDEDKSNLSLLRFMSFLYLGEGVCVLLVLFLCVLLICVGFYLCWKNKCRTVCKGLRLMPKKWSPPDDHYIAIKAGNSPSRDGHHQVGHTRERFFSDSLNQRSPPSPVKEGSHHVSSRALPKD